MAKISDLITSTARRFGLPVDLFSQQVQTESAGDARAVSPKGAIGLAQIMPATAKEMGYTVTEMLDPAKNLEAGAKYMRRMLSEAKRQNPSLSGRGLYTAALAAYNAGPGGASEFIKTGDVSTLPAETRGYIQKIGGGQTDTKQAKMPGRNLLEGIDVSKLKAQAPGRDLVKEKSLIEKAAGLADTGFEKLTGGLEAIASMATGATTGAVAYGTGALEGIAKSALEGKFGTQEGIKMAEETAAKRAGQYTFQPRTEEGRRQLAAVGQVAEQLAPITPIAGEIQAVTQAARPAITAAGQQAGQAARQAAVPTIQRAQQIVQPAMKRAQQAVQRAPSVEPGSAGAAATPQAVQRIAQAEQLPVPVQLTKGQATREFAQQQFERETAKLPEIGAPLRERYAKQNEQVLQNFDAWVDETGAEAPDLRAVGKIVDQAIVNKANKAKQQIRSAYKAADAAGELEQPVALPGLVAHLNDAVPEVATAPVIDVAIKKAIRLGLAEEMPDGTLTPKAAPLKNVEAFRQSMVRSADPAQAPNMRQVSIMKGLIDDETEGLGGNAYKYARRKRAEYAREFENRAVISKLLRNKPGTTDRAVAFEDVFKSAIQDGSLDDVRNVRKTLMTAGPEGKQAWKELQGQTMAQLRDAAFSNAARDERGNPILSAGALDKRIKLLDADGKMDFIFGKKGAQQVRDMNDLAKVIYTSPPGSINTSNTASALRVALDAMVTGSVTGVPAPAMTAIKALIGKIKDRKLAARVRDALNGTSERLF